MDKGRKARQEKMARILEEIASGGTMREACRNNEISPSTFRDNVNSAQYARALQLSADMQFDELEDWARMTLEGTVDPQAAKVAIDTRKWCLAKRRPEKFGDSQKLDLSNSDGTLAGAPQTLKIVFVKPDHE